jgi:secreted Zn-dependent insulinase-like peptidase
MFRRLRRASILNGINAFTTKEQTCYYARVLDTNIREAMDVLSDIMLNATFEQREMEKEKLVVIEELKNAEDDPEDIIHDYFEKTLFPRHSLGNPVIGTEANVLGFRREDLKAHVRAHYRPTQIVVAAAGNVDHDLLARLVNRYLGHLRGEDEPKSRQSPAPGAFSTGESEKIPPRWYRHIFSALSSASNIASLSLMVVNTRAKRKPLLRPYGKAFTIGLFVIHRKRWAYRAVRHLSRR